MFAKSRTEKRGPLGVESSPAEPSECLFYICAEMFVDRSQGLTSL